MRTRTNQELSERYRRHARWGIVASLLIHAALLFGIRDDLALPPSPFAAAGPRAGDDRAAAGGGGMRAIQIRVPETPPDAVVPPEPTPVPIPEPVVEPEPEAAPRVTPPKEEAVAAAAPLGGSAEETGQGEGKGEAEGPGLEGGTGRGDGGTAESGRFRVVPPSPRGLILPPSDRPKRVRGKEVAVWVFVTAAGRVVPDSTRLDPTTGDGKFDKRLRQQAAEWVFEPARKGGRAVAEWFRYVLVL